MFQVSFVQTIRLTQSDIGEVSNSILWGFSIFPPFALYRGLVYLGVEVARKGPGYSMSNLDESVVNLAAVYGFLIVEWFVMMGLWMYCQQVIPSGWGVKKHPLFFLGFGKTPVLDKYVTDTRTKLTLSVANLKLIHQRRM